VARRNGSGSRRSPQGQGLHQQAAYRHAPLSAADRQANRRKSGIHAKVEHPFLILKRLWGLAKARYRGLAKNANRAFAMLAAINILNHGRLLAGEVRPA
jgi:IS5 family transposase